MAKRSKTAAPVKMFPVLDVFAAACAAHRINDGAYYKDTVYSSTSDDKGNYPIAYYANKVVMRHLLVGDPNITAKWEVTDEDRQNAVVVRDYWQSKFMEVLAGTANEFTHNAMTLAGKEEIAANDWLGMATIAYLPNGHVRGVERDQRKEKKMDATICSQHFGQVGDKVSGTATILDCNYSMNWNVYYVTAKFNNNVILFTYKNKLDVNQIVQFKGSIKQHRDDSITQLTRVRIDN